MQLLLAAVALVAAMKLLDYAFDKWLFGGERRNHEPKLDPKTGRWTYSNWGGNQVFTPKDVVRPRSLQELIDAVERHGRAGRKIKAVAALHSWSACAVAEDVCIEMAGLNRVLAHDAKAKTITAEAGIPLHALYAAMDERDLAIASIPNVDTIQLGGAISNATHGTNFSRGTMSSYVTQLQMVLFRNGRAELVTLKRGQGDWFEAAVASFGSLGILYSITLQCEEPYACFVIERNFPFDHIDGRIEELAKKHYSAFINVATSNGACRSRIQAPIPRDLVEADTACLLTRNDLRILKVLLWAASPTATTWLRTRRLLNRALYDASLGSTSQKLANRKRAGVMSWRDAELLSRVFAVTATAPWINLEYAVPVWRADEAARRLLALVRKYKVLTGFIMRPVGADTAGFLSPAKDRPTVFFDIGYHQALIHTGVYAEIEKLLLECEGRCSWSRLFKAPLEEIVKQYPQYPDFLRAKREMDPDNVFSNKFSDSILGGFVEEARAAG
ncbi:MAG: FAD-binding protein [Myxococcales bacterium]